MAWNTPGSKNSGNGNRPSRRPPGGGGFDAVLDQLRGLFGGSGGAGGIGRWLLLLVGLWLAFNCFVLIAETERGVVLRFGQFSRVMQPGPHFKLPWPLERVTKVKATQIRTMSDNVPVLTSDENIVHVEINVQYQVNDPQRYLFGTRDPDEVLRQAALSTMREQVGRSTLDTVLGARNALAVSSREQLQASLDAYRTGLVVTELNLPNARPPEQVKPAFDDVNSAQQERERLISEARAYAAKVVPEARGGAARIRTEAEGYKTAKVAKATGDADRFSLLVDEYKQAPEVTRKRLWLETVQEVLAGNRKIIGDDSRQLIYSPMSGGRGGGAAPAVSPELLAPALGTPDPAPSSTRGGRPSRPDGREEARQ
ncbi:FtsH protease activity modulator HflK [Marilutibacter aestuarii]|uniref:Protein HflK n=1 Tax=Marilutibacter aestuarii TaxID=1706195 RepID=A0A508A9G6_9GAMM|nr:FtsH protease activity modulator HflK [Lysobacter aestuarii]TQD45201.1 FtsH protease activity modulator HflK [Lysobacter aestuarii]